MGSVRVAILGASGFGAGELLRLCAQHPEIEVSTLTSSSQVGRPIHELHPHLRGFFDLATEEEVNTERLLEAEHAVVFSALPHGASSTAIDKLLTRVEKRRGAKRLRMIDLSGDLRLRNVDLHLAHYPDSPVLAERRSTFAYGLPELFRAQIRPALHVANPGCLASASILALAPLAGDLTGSVAIDAKTGSSGSGRQLRETTHHPTRHANFRAYKPLRHQHEPEILQALGDPVGNRLEVSFVAQSMDTARGIYVTAHLTLSDPVAQEDLLERYEAFYADSPFVRIVAEAPELQNVVGSNFCDLGVACRGRSVVVMAALDNLVKGMAGTAIQNLNLMCGLSETTGLWTPSFRPV
ncbi:MAG: N-acetyl-gamma-glutamyl-phosphate reductase [bacterium]|nr:N-acetyl-gamma-glutamyl-phosphate reductase [bacterium]